MSNKKLFQELSAVVGADYVVHHEADLIAFEYDGSVDKALPWAVVLPSTSAEVSAIVKIARQHNVPIVPRGAGTGLSGGAIPTQGGIMMALTRMTRITEIDPENRLAIVEPGVVNIDLSVAASQYGLYFAPDPSSQKACTIGGNVAENSGGPHCLAYGVTTNHVLGMEVVLADGTIAWVGGRTQESPGLDLRGILIGSEGTLAITTKIVVKLLREPEAVRTLLAVYTNLDDGSAAVSDIIGSGIVPAAIEMMDGLMIKAAEPAVHAGYPPDADAVLLVEVEGLRESVEEESDLIQEVCRRHNPVEIRTAEDAEQREKLWAGRKGALGALGRLAPNYYLIDGTIPRTKLVEVMARIKEISKESGYPIANVLHAGDGNLHPCVLFDERKPGDVENITKVGEQILKLCVDVGGVLSGEHGIGTEKQAYMPFMFSEDDMAAMALLKVAFDTKNMLNPGKVFPVSDGCTGISQMGAIARAGAGAFI